MRRLDQNIVYLGLRSTGRGGTGAPKVEVGLDEGYAAEKTLVVLRRSNQTYRLEPFPGVDVWINGERADTQALNSGDVIEIASGSDGLVLRFRQYEPGSDAYKTLGEAFADCVECARHAHSGPEGLRMLTAGLLRELVGHVSPLTRVAVVAAVILFVAALGALWRQNQALERRFAEERLRIEGLAVLLEDSEREAFNVDDFSAARADLDIRIAETLARLDALENRAGARARVIAEASRSVIFLQGAYGFDDPDSGRPLRLASGPDGRPLRDPLGNIALKLGGDGEPLELRYTGTGFVVSELGHVVTNRHVAQPWDFDDNAKRILANGFEPVMRRFVGYLPGNGTPLAIGVVGVHDEADVALLRCDSSSTEVAALELTGTVPELGAEVIVLGYPTGMRALLARAEPTFVERVTSGGSVDFWNLARELASGGYVQPLATVGVVGQATVGSIVYDAETTHGGSGGPVLNLDGRVVAINAAVLPEFGGSNLGVPAAAALELLEPQLVAIEAASRR